MTEMSRYEPTDRPAPKTGLYARFGKVRCPKCGRRLQLLTFDIEQGYGDFWPYIPPHKVRKLKARRSTKTERRKVRAEHKKRGRGPARGK